MTLRPDGAQFCFIRASRRFSRASFERIFVNPLRRCVFRAPKRRTRRVIGEWIIRTVDVKRKEQHGFAFLRYHAETVSIVPTTLAQLIFVC